MLSSLIFMRIHYNIYKLNGTHGILNIQISPGCVKSATLIFEDF